MKNTFVLLLGALLMIAMPACAAAEKHAAQKPAVWTDSKKAEKEFPDFLLQGEYTGKMDGKEVGVQAAALLNGTFLVSIRQGGLPGAGWDRSKIDSRVLKRDELKKLVGALTRVERVSETIGLKAPEGALVMFDGKQTEHIKGTIEDGLLWAGAQTTTEVGSFGMHLEFRLPFKPGRNPSNQDRGNSGVYIFNNYECQVLDSFALDYHDKENNAIKTESLNTQWCGCFYKFRIADQNMCYPPLRWQTYDIEFTAATFKDGKKITNARVTVKHNGVVIHDDLELPKGTGMGGRRPEKEKGLIILQQHGNPVAYRNFWIKEK